MTEDFTTLSGFVDVLKESIIDAGFDTLYVIPFLLITYLILEYIEHRMTKKSQEAIKKAGVAGPAIGAIFGIIPQCGFSSAASTFYAGRVITVGTLFAVYLSTSDEMIPIFIAGGIPVETLISILAFKFLAGMGVGFLIDFGMKLIHKTDPKFLKHDFEIHEMCERERCSCDHNHSKNIVVPALIHTLQITIFIFLISLILGLLIEFFGGDEAIRNFVDGNKFASIAACGLVGLIPNCAASVVISQLYVDGIIGGAALITGLLSAAGVGLIVLFRTNRPF